jgi:hypothetical protein
MKNQDHSVDHIINEKNRIIIKLSEENQKFRSALEEMLDKDKIIKWINEEIKGFEIRGETDKEIAMTGLLLKIERGYFDNK